MNSYSDISCSVHGIGVNGKAGFGLEIQSQGHENTIKLFVETTDKKSWRN